MLALVLVQSSIPFLTQSLIDVGIGNQQIGFIYIIIFAQFIVFTSQAIASLVRDQLVLFIGIRVNILILSRFFFQLLKLPMSFFLMRKPEDILQRVLDSQRIQDFLTAFGLGSLISILNLGLFSLILIYFSPVVFFIFLTGFSLFALWIIGANRKRYRLEVSRYDKTSSHMAQVQDMIFGAAEIHNNLSSNKRGGMVDRTQLEKEKANNSLATLDQYQVQFGLLINELTSVAITLYAANLVLNGNLTVGALLAIPIHTGTTQGPVDTNNSSSTGFGIC